MAATMMPIAATDPMTAPAMIPAWLLLETPSDATTEDELLVLSGNPGIVVDESTVPVPVCGEGMLLLVL
jgi:hypothetical protein